MESPKIKLKRPIYSWYALYTRANQEKKLYNWLQEENIECYLPLKKTLRKWSDRKKWSEEPLFRCYLFVRVSYKEYFNVLHMAGVARYVSFGGVPQSIPDDQIDSIKILVQQQEREIEVDYNNARRGSTAEVLVGPLRGLKGEIVKLCGQYRLMIRIVSMGCTLLVNISKDEIKLLKTEKEPSRRNTSRLYRTLQNTPYRKNGVFV